MITFLVVKEIKINKPMERSKIDLYDFEGKKRMF